MNQAILKRDVFHYDLIKQFNEETFGKCLFPNHIVEDEIAIKNKETEEMEYFFPMKKDGVNYLLPSQYAKELPLFPSNTLKVAYRSKAYERVIGIENLKIKPVHTMSYKEMIDNWLDYKHDRKDLFTLHKIIVEASRVSRINVRIMTYPGWMKDSPLTVLGELFGDCVTVNKPTMAKLKHLLPNNKVIGLNEVNKVVNEKRDELAMYYEDTGDFKPKWVNNSRAVGGAVEECELKNSSSLTFYNLPGDNEVKEQVLFDHIFHPKVLSRIFPLFFTGGSNTETACKEKFSHQVQKITLEEKETIKEFLKNMAYYEENYPSGREKWTRSFEMPSVRWDRNYKTILSRVDLYCESQEEFDRFERLLYDSHKSYMDLVYGGN